MSSHPMLKTGSSGSSVKELQARLEANGFDPGAADGIFGPKTEAAVKGFQRKWGLAVDGIVGNATWGKLQELGL
jgi:peptidoglycan hydrolase-like protein with peptidoglycan-binding domain